MKKLSRELEENYQWHEHNSKDYQIAYSAMKNTKYYITNLSFNHLFGRMVDVYGLNENKARNIKHKTYKI